MNHQSAKQLTLGRRRAISVLKACRFAIVPVVVAATAFHALGAPLSVIAGYLFIFCILGVYGFYTIRFLISLLEDESQGYNFGFWVAIIGLLVVVLPMAPAAWHIKVVTDEKLIDWVVAGGVLLGTGWIANGVLLARKEEQVLQQAVELFEGPQLTVSSIIPHAVLLASRYCRNGLLFVLLATLLQIGGLVFEANPWLGEILHLRSHEATDAAAPNERAIGRAVRLPRPLPC